MDVNMSQKVKKSILQILLVAAFLTLQGCADNSQRTKGEEESTIRETETEESEVSSGSEIQTADNDLQNQILEAMTLEEKVSQMFMPTLEGLTEGGIVTEAGSAVQTALEQYPVGGIILFEENVTAPGQISELTANLNHCSMEHVGLPMLIGTDEEGGRVTRFANNPNFPVEAISDMADIGATGDGEAAYQAGTAIGTYLQQYGLNLDFAPVADVLTNPDNQVIGARSFGSDPQLVAEMTAEVAGGMQEHGVYACLKHFPGHGTTSADTHTGAVYTDKSLEELKALELIPFQRGIEDGISFIMVSHISAPKVTGKDEPASLSGTMITDVLRQDMGYQGIVITDAMNMGAITGRYSSSEAAVRAIAAGVDIILMPENFREAYQGVLNAVADGTMTEERIDESVKRILAVKLEIIDNTQNEN